MTKSLNFRQALTLFSVLLAASREKREKEFAVLHDKREFQNGTGEKVNIENLNM
jgi:hypothetical protein